MLAMMRMVLACKHLDDLLILVAFQLHFIFEHLEAKHQVLHKLGTEDFSFVGKKMSPPSSGRTEKLHATFAL